MAQIAYARRIRRTPFSDGVDAAGATSYSVYNRMLLPAVFRSPEDDYYHLKRAVQVWDVSCERQVELRGKDATRLMRLLTPRDLRTMQPGQCRYAPVVDAAGGMLNDPVAVMLAEDRWWVSLADSDLLFWIMGLATGLRLDVKVFEPDVSPLAVQGPRSDDLMARVFGDGVRDVRFFRYGIFPFAGSDLVVARSGYSKQGGFEIYLEGSDLGMPLWQALFEAGKDLDLRAGCPSLIERVEGGLLSYGNDFTQENTPLECGLGRYCNLDSSIEFIGRDALLREAETGPKRQIRAIAIDGPAVPVCDRVWPLLAGDTVVGGVTSTAWSPMAEINVAIGMVDRDHWTAGTALTVAATDGVRTAEVQEAFWA